MLSLPAFVPGMALAVGIGLLIGFERGWQLRNEQPGRRVAGVRTFAVLGLLGGLAGWAAQTSLAWIALVTSVGAVAALLLGHALDMRRDRTVSATSAIAGLVTMLLGALASSGQYALAAAAAAVMVAVLSARRALHGLLQQTSEEDVRALVRLALVALLVLPLLPDAGVDPFGVLNPRRVWFVVVVVSGISFAGYVLARWLGDRRGGLAAAAIGALISSTAVTVAAAQAIRSGGGPANQTSIALASVVMLARTIVLVALLAPLALPDVAVMVGPALAVASVAAAVLFWRTRHQGSTGSSAAKPPGLATALLFGGLVAALTVIAAWAEHSLGGGSGAAVVAIGGMVDVDSAIAAIGALPPSDVSPQLAAFAIALPIASNSLLKLVLAVSIAGWRQAGWAAASLALPIVVIAVSAAGLLL